MPRCCGSGTASHDAAPDDFTIATQATRAITTGGLPPNVAAAIAGNVRELERVTLEQLAGTLERSSLTMRWLLAAVAAVSLLVGGIGIMNITLLSVTERTREIGLRLAVGARGKDVMRQFLIEAVAISLAGGFVGVLCGVARVGGDCTHAEVGDGRLAGRGAAGVWRRRRQSACSSAGIRRAAPRPSIRSRRFGMSNRQVQFDAA